MHLDMLTMSAVNIAVTAVLGLVLVFTWARERGSPFVGWWGVALLLMSAGIVAAATASLQSAPKLLALGQATMILAEALKWQAARQFAYHRAYSLWTFAGPVLFLLAVQSGYLETFGGRLILACALMALYNFAASIELSTATGERLMSRWPAVVLLFVTGLSFLSWLPLISIMPVQAASAVFSSEWLPGVVLGNLLLRVALAFIVLSLAKERQELGQRVDALTDALTGLPNRRALFEVADALGQARGLKGDPISVLLFDLDHFKQTNDSFGHEVGDQVLKLFAATVSEELDGPSFVARLGGEEFAAILPGADPEAALCAAETVRSAFAKSGAFVEGLEIGGTVSVGVASDTQFDSDLGGLFRRADAALYAAKRAGRNRVECLGHEATDALAEVTAALRASQRKVQLRA